MHDHDAPSKYHCFRCHSGAVHLICGNLMVRLTPDQFLALAEAVKNMQQQIQEEMSISTALTCPDQMVM